MKKRTLLSLLGLMASIAMPIYAQDVEEDVVLDAEPVAEETEEVVAEDLDESLDQFVAENPEVVDELNAGLDEFLGALEEENEGITDEFYAKFTTDEERAAAAVGLLAIFAGFGLIA